MIAEIEKLNLKWSEPRPIQTGRGPRMLRSASLNGSGQIFWRLWKSEKSSLQHFGFSPSKDFSGNWFLNHWVPEGGFAPEPEIEIEPEAPLDLTGLDQLGLLPWQVPSCARLIRALQQNNSALDASDVGTGKTYTALAAAKTLGLTPVVICPLSVVPSWHRAATHFGIKIFALNYEKLRTGKSDFGSWGEGKKVFHFLNLAPNSILIFDEVHRCKSMVSQNSKMLLAASRQKIKTLCLSATAFIDPTEMRGIGEVLGLFARNDFYKWAKNNGCSSGKFGGLAFTGGRKTLAQIHSQIFPKKGSRVRVADLGDTFPETFVTTESVAVSETGGKKINEAMAIVQETIERIAIKQARDGDNVLTALLRARQISEAEKVPAISELASDAIEQGQSVVAFVNFSETINDLQKTLNSLSISTIHGLQTAEEREKSIADFQIGKTKLMIANIQAGGVGVSLHDTVGDAPRLALICPSWSAVAMRQALGRVHRAGGKTKSIQKILFAANTVEEGICEAVEAKLENLDLMNDGDLI